LRFAVQRFKAYPDPFVSFYVITIASCIPKFVSLKLSLDESLSHVLVILPYALLTIPFPSCITALPPSRLPTSTPVLCATVRVPESGKQVHGMVRSSAQSQVHEEAPEAGQPIKKEGIKLDAHTSLGKKKVILHAVARAGRDWSWIPQKTCC
jgi:hypothetical protein